MNQTHQLEAEHLVDRIASNPTKHVSVFLNDGASSTLLEDVQPSDIPNLSILYPPMLEIATVFIPVHGAEWSGSPNTFQSKSGRMSSVAFSPSYRPMLFHPERLTESRLSLSRSTCYGFLAWLAFLSGEGQTVHAVFSPHQGIGWLTHNESDVETYVRELRSRCLFDIHRLTARYDGQSVEMSINLS